MLVYCPLNIITMLCLNCCHEPSAASCNTAQNKCVNFSLEPFLIGLFLSHYLCYAGRALGSAFCCSHGVILYGPLAFSTQCWELSWKGTSPVTIVTSVTYEEGSLSSECAFSADFDKVKKLAFHQLFNVNQNRKAEVRLNSCFQMELLRDDMG